MGKKTPLKKKKSPQKKSPLTKAAIPPPAIPKAVAARKSPAEPPPGENDLPSSQPDTDLLSKGFATVDELGPNSEMESGSPTEENPTMEAPLGSPPTLDVAASVASASKLDTSTVGAEIEKRTLPNVNAPCLGGAEPQPDQEGGLSMRPDSQVPSRTKPGVKTWAECVSGKSHSLQMRGEQYRIESGELCVTIPNAVISKNKKAWANFVLGQFHGNLPSMGALHAILNGIWSNKIKDIAISRVGAQSVLIKIPNAATRKRVLEQGVWHIEGQSMFVAEWEPGMQMEVPEVKEVPVWVDFKGVPPHFFSEEGFEYIASLVGQPLHLHPRTAGMLNLEVARVFTLVDLTQPFPEAVYVAFESGERQKIEVSCPWLPPKCSHCHQFGHSLRRCPKAPILCNNCRSTTHEAIDCFRVKNKSTNLVRKQGQKMWKPVSEEARTTQPKPQATHSVEVSKDQPAQDSTVAHSAGHSQPALVDTLHNMMPDLPTQRVDHQVGNKKGTSAPVSRFNKGITINEPAQTAPLPKKLARVEGKGKTKILQPDKTSSDSDSSAESEEDGRIVTDAMDLPKSKRYGQKPAKGRGPSAQPSS